MESTLEFRRLVKDALEHLYDAAYLETHPLLAQFPLVQGLAWGESSDTRLTRAQKLRTLLKDAVEALRPQEASPTQSPEWRSYLALRYRYVRGMSAGETEAELGISLRQLQRELHKGLDAVAALLWDKRTTDRAGSQAAASSTAPEEHSELEGELDRWEIARQSCDVQALVDEALWTCKPLLTERGISVETDWAANLAPIFVDATLTRQAFFKILRAVIRSAQTAVCTLRAQAQEKAVHLTLHVDAVGAFQEQADWRIAQRICAQQGIGLVARAFGDAGSEISLTLPQAAQPRVLVIDDNAAIHQLFERYLAPHHYETIHAHGGRAALELAEIESPDAITLDVMMPNVDGWQVLRGLTGNPATAHIPIIVCSVLQEPELAFSLGARAYLKKPVDRLELVATLARLLSSAARASEEPQPAPEDK